MASICARAYERAAPCERGRDLYYTRAGGHANEHAALQVDGHGLVLKSNPGRIKAVDILLQSNSCPIKQ